jgi:hypothetical protein
MIQRILAAVALAALVPPSAAAVTLEVIPSTTTASIGDTVTVDVVISDLGNLAAPSLGTFDLDLQYNSAVFSFGGAVFGPELGDPMAAEAITTTTPGMGVVNLLELSLLSPAILNANQPDTFTLFTASFDAVAAGTAVFTVASNALGDENGDPLILDAVIPATVDVEGAPGLQEIPTLSQWGLALLAALLAWAAARGLRRAER